MADLIIQIGHLSYWRHLRRMTCGPSPNLMGNVWHFDLNVMGPGIENNLCFATTNVSRRLGNNRQGRVLVIVATPDPPCGRSGVATITRTRRVENKLGGGLQIRSFSAREPRAHQTFRRVREQRELGATRRNRHFRLVPAANPISTYRPNVAPSSSPSPAKSRTMTYATC